MKIKHYFFALALMLAPSFAHAQTLYTDEKTPNPNTMPLMFTVQQISEDEANNDGLLLNLLNLINVQLGSVLDFNNPLTLPTNLHNLISNGGIKVNVPANYLTATIMGPNNLSGTLTIPSTVWNESISSDTDLSDGLLSLLSLGIANGSLVDLGLLGDVLGIKVLGNSLVDVNALGGFIHLNILPYGDADDPTDTLGIPVVAINDAAFSGNGIKGLNMQDATNLETIGNQAFENCQYLKGDLDLSKCKSLKTIGKAAFSGDDLFDGVLNLSGLTALETIGSSAFYSLENLTGGIDLSGDTNLQTIGNAAFNSCTSLNGGIDLSGCVNLQTIDDIVFGNCHGLTGGINLSGDVSLQTIGDYAFENCENMAGELNISGLTNLTTIGDGAFMYQSGTKLTGSIDLSGSKKLERIGNSAFYNITLVTGGIDLSNNTQLTYIGSNAFYKCTNLDGELKLSGLTSLDTIGYNAFYQDSKLTGELNLSDASKLTTIGQWAFYLLSNLTGDAKMPASLTSVGTMSFQDCSGLKSFSFMDNNITNLGNQLFVNCSNLEYIDMSKCYVDSLPSDIHRSIITSPFYHTPAHTVIYLPKDDNNGTYAKLVSEAAQILSGSNENYVETDVDGNRTCQWLAIEDGTDYFMPYAFKATKAAYYANNATSIWLPPTSYRTFTSSSSIYLPYSFKVDSNTSSVGIYALAHFKEHGEGDADDTFAFWKQETGKEIEANTPYIVRIDGGSGVAQLPVATNADVPASPTGYFDNGMTSKHVGADGTVFTDSRIQTTVNADDPMPAGKLPAVEDTDGTIWTLTGTNELVNNATAAGKNTWYFGSDGKWYASDKGTYDLTQFRVFLLPDKTGVTPSAKMLNFSFVDENGNSTTPTGIDSVNSERVTGNNSIYTINGQYAGNDINALPKGIYIVNGKKVVK